MAREGDTGRLNPPPPTTPLEAVTDSGGAQRGGPMRVFDALAFTSIGVALAAASLCAAAARAMSGVIDPATALLAAAGTLVVYNVDRLRDVERDRVTSPVRTHFIETHASWLRALTVLGAGVALLTAWVIPWSGWVLLVGVSALGFFHRRLKDLHWWKPLYVAGSWAAVTVGLPAVAREAHHVPWVTAVILATILANVIASNLRDDEAASARFGPGVPLRAARGAALAGLLLALAGPAAVRPLAFVPGATLVALGPFSSGERYGAIAVDGALLLGALGALLAH